MNKKIAYCGLSCSDCPVFIATQSDDQQERNKIAELWSKDYGFKLKTEDINCDGCLETEGRLFKHCKVCDVRECGQKRNVDNCAYCSEFPCKKLDYILKAVPAAKKTLQRIKEGL